MSNSVGGALATIPGQVATRTQTAKEFISGVAARNGSTVEKLSEKQMGALTRIYNANPRNTVEVLGDVVEFSKPKQAGALKKAQLFAQDVFKKAKDHPGKTALIAAGIVAAGVGIGVAVNKVKEANAQKEAAPIYA